MAAAAAAAAAADAAADTANAAYASDAAHAAYAAYAAANAAYANAAYAANANADAAAHAAYAAANAAYAANADAKRGGEKKTWQWLYQTYRHAGAAEGLTFAPAWKTATTTAMAKEVVANRSFDLMPILADALQDAGCDNAELLAHLRGDTEEMTLADWTLCHLLGLWDGEANS